MSNDYIVVFEYLGKNDVPLGLTFVERYTSLGDFEKRFTPEIAKRQRVVAKGISLEEATKLTITKQREQSRDKALDSRRGLDPNKPPRELIFNHRLE